MTSNLSWLVIAIFICLLMPLGFRSNRLLMLLLVYLCSSIIFIIEDFYFIGLTYLIVYVGAIAILFMFVIMMLPSGEADTRTDAGVVTLLGLVLFSYVLLTSHISYMPSVGWSSKWQYYTDINTLAQTIFVAYPISLILIGIILWIVLIGIISITTTETQHNR